MTLWTTETPRDYILVTATYIYLSETALLLGYGTSREELATSCNDRALEALRAAEPNSWKPIQELTTDELIEALCTIRRSARDVIKDPTLPQYQMIMNFHDEGLKHRENGTRWKQHDGSRTIGYALGTTRAPHIQG